MLADKLPRFVRDACSLADVEGHGYEQDFARGGKSVQIRRGAAAVAGDSS